MTTQESFTLRNTAGSSIALSVMEHDGLGLTAPLRAVQQGPYQHGATLSAAHLPQRTITLKVVIKGTSESNLRAQTDELAQLLNRLDAVIYLDVTRPDATVRRLDVYHAKGLELPRKAGQLRNATIDVIQLVADNPIAYTSAVVSETLALGAGDSTGFEIPMDMPFTIGAATIDTYAPVTYSGTWPAYPTVRIVGPITNAVVTNDTTDEKLDFTGYTIAAGEWIEIDCRYGYKTVEDESGNNELDELTTDSDLATFHLAPADEASGGVNDFHVTGSACTGATRVYMSYYTRWISVL